MTAYYEPGTYLCEVIEQGFQESKTGKPMIMFKIKVVAKCVYGPEGEEFENCRETYDRTVRLVVDGTNDTMMDYVMRKLRYAGFDGDSFADLNMTGKEIRCVCGTGEYNGKPVETWDMALPPMESKPLESMDSAATRKLNTLFGKRLKEGAKPKVAVPMTAASNGPPPDDEVPF